MSAIARVLVVDDEADLRELLDLSLARMGLQADLAGGVAQARQCLTRQRYALVITDMRMPDGDGLEVVRAAAELAPDTPVAVLTAFGSSDNAVAALKAGAFDYLSKPVSLDGLRQLVLSVTRPAVAVSSASAALPTTPPVVSSGVSAVASPVESAVATAAGPASTPVSYALSGPASAQASATATAAVRPTVGGAAALTFIDTPPSPNAAAPSAPVSSAKPVPGGHLLGQSVAMQGMRATVARVARSMAPVAIFGESGSGKELVARSIHAQSLRAAGPFIAVNCGAIPETLMEAEFFGYRKGAFTGAERDREGLFQAAHGGTLFLDEVADLPLPMQVKLLRAIQEKRVRVVGATQETPVDVRILSATHQDLARCVAAGRFRQDLFYRLNVIELRVPPLRDRRDDIPMLADAILDKLAKRAGVHPAPRLASVTLKYLQSYQFPGNVREFENLLERAMAFAEHGVIRVEDLGLRPAWGDDDAPAFDDPATLSGAPSSAGSSLVSPLALADAEIDAQGVAEADKVSAGSYRLGADGVPDSLPAYLHDLERQAIEAALRRTQNNRTAAARELGITFRALRHRMQRLGFGAD